MDWFALYVKPQHEKAAEGQLKAKFLETYLPSYVSRRRWSDRIKSVELPLFPGYVFCRFRFEERSKLLSIRSVVSIVGFGGQPCSICDIEIQTIKRVVASGLSITPGLCLRMGERVRVCGGPLVGLEGILKREKAIHRVVVNIDLLQRAIAVEIEREFIEPSRSASSPLLPVSAYNA